MKQEMLQLLHDVFHSCEGWENSAEIAIYWYANDFHEGQASDLYSILSTSPYNPGILASCIEDEDDELAQEMYIKLEQHYA